MDLCKVNFCIRKLFMSVIQVAAARTKQVVSLYIQMHVNALVHVCPVFVCLCLWYQIKVIAKTMHPCQT